MQQQSTAMLLLLQEPCCSETISDSSQTLEFLSRQVLKRAFWAVQVQFMLSRCMSNGAKTHKVFMPHGASTSKTWKEEPQHLLSFHLPLV